VPAPSVHHLSRQWTERLATYRRHRNAEHVEALVEEAARYAGLRLENELAESAYWSRTSLSRRVAVLLFLVDRGVVERLFRNGRRVYAPLDNAEHWVASQPTLAPYAGPTLELVAALRNEVNRQAKPR
jgi:hypothetical protein